MVLLDLLLRLRDEHGFELAALHINHQLNVRADDWAALCARRCRRCHVPFREVRVEVNRDDARGLEAAARAARYAVFSEQDADAIVLAHQLDDQAETLLLQLLRGAGPRGLAGMPSVRALASGDAARLVRPLLEVPRARIEAYARRHRLHWAQDDSNRDTALDRNYLRHEILPLVQKRFPAYRQTWLRASRNFADLSEIAEECAAADAQGALEPDGLRLSRLSTLSPARARNVLRWYLAREGLLAPPRELLEQMFRQFVQGRPDSQPEVELAGVRLYRQRGLLKLAPAPSAGPGDWEVPWIGERELLLPGGLGALHFERVAGVGLAADRLLAGRLVVRSRRGGERIKLAPNRPSRTLKNLLREARLSPWERERLPLLALDDAVIWVAGLGLDSRFAAGPGEAGVLPHWRHG